MKQNLFRIFKADGKPDDYGTSAMFDKKDKGIFLAVATVYTSARVTKKSDKKVAFAYQTRDKDAKGPWNKFCLLLSRAGVAWKKEQYDPASFHGESLMTFSNAGGAIKGRDTGNAILKLAKKIQELPDTVADVGYAGGGKVVSAKSGTVTVTYLIPYDEKAAAKNRTENEADALSKKTVAQTNNDTSTINNDTARKDNESANLNSETEKTKAQTATSKTLRWIGIATVAAVVIAAVAIVAIKARKNK